MNAKGDYLYDPNPDPVELVGFYCPDCFIDPRGRNGARGPEFCSQLDGYDVHS